jgi:zinc transporter
MYVLSIVAAMFLPLGFLTGLLGINLGGIPGAESPFGFLAFSLLMFLILGLQLWFFTKKRWF